MAGTVARWRIYRKKKEERLRAGLCAKCGKFPKEPRVQCCKRCVEIYTRNTKKRVENEK